MTFTDDDLKRLEEDIEIGGVSWNAPFFGPLLARLEAAEAALGFHGEGCSCEHARLEAWREAAGK
jgi:hypothetical protein